MNCGCMITTLTICSVCRWVRMGRCGWSLSNRKDNKRVQVVVQEEVHAFKLSIVDFITVSTLPWEGRIPLLRSGIPCKVLRKHERP